MPLEATASTAATSLLESAAVNSAIATIVGELKSAQTAIRSVRPPADELKHSYEAYLQRYAICKGRPAWYPYVGSGLGRGALVELADGSVKWDLINGIGVYMFGHSDPVLIETALRAAMSDTVMQGNLQFNADAIEFSEFLIAEASKNSNLRHAFLINTGAMANECALKVCYQKNHPADRVIAFSDCFMGRSTTMAQIGDNAEGRVGLPVTVPVDYVPFYDPEIGEKSIDRAVDQLKRYLHRYPGRHACFAMELVQGEGGFNTAPREFFVPLMELCREHHIAVWLDEIQTFGRTTEMFCFDSLDLGDYVDVVTIGKMSQVCAVLYTEEYNPKPGLLSATFIGSTVGLKVGRVLLERLRQGDYYGPDGRIAALQNAFRRHAKSLVQNHPECFPPLPGGSTRFYDGVGGMMRFTPFGGRKEPIIRACRALFDEGVIAFYCGHDPYHIRFLPPIGVLRPEHFDVIFEIVERGLASVTEK